MLKLLKKNLLNVENFESGRSRFPNGIENGRKTSENERAAFRVFLRGFRQIVENVDNQGLFGFS
jgi:hypothetical protein